ncbi:hypothetical protein A3G50_00120 [Candidatus Jorgensenbacteria bacterium RIFCSPLOWO2_12_FULL_42_11]|uniref:Uncharacterized protein n=1 Tax=Candidatus Jorgensenbacteria bacterium RIFCSPLOWO2_12_FULL_42_11 TaxID=1798473 RepID=A0A1F6C352_9BACT|nr:MAG: hypothetical protein A3G50_00120 [Candidatus Jorgensenbacteria bacterium RIFCSPLOWO2_12_FULL_42_11]
MGESLMERRRVQDEGLRIVNCFSIGKSPSPLLLMISIRIQQVCEKQAFLFLKNITSKSGEGLMVL